MRFSVEASPAQSFGEMLEGFKKFKPVLPLLLRHGEKLICVEALIDSGASMSCASMQLARELGVDLSSAGRIQCRGFNGVVMEGLMVEKELHHILINNRRQILDWQSRLCFFENVSEQVLLGVEGFFDRFKVDINANKKEIHLKRM